MAYFTKEQIDKAREIDLLTYFECHDPNELVYDGRNTYSTKTHDSLKINNGMWYWFSRGIGGVSALDYLVKVEELSFTDAISRLINERGIEKNYVSFKRELTEKEKIDRLKLPKRANNNQKVCSYLFNRCIDKDIINECISKGYIYQDYPNNNVVFVGFDENNNPRYAGIRGTNQTRYMHDAYGSDKSYSFKLLSNVENNSIHLFESAIDLLSYATLLKKNNIKWYEENLISLAGIYQSNGIKDEIKIPKTLSTYLKNNQNIDTIYLHFDNDKAGRLSSESIKISLSESYKIIDNPPKIGKDFNDYLCFLSGKSIKNFSGYER